MDKIKILPKDTYLAIIKNSAGSTAFRDFYGTINGKKINLTKNGDLSCAYFVSSILKIFSLIENIHLTVDGTIKSMGESGWAEIKKDKITIGDVIIWQEEKSSTKNRQVQEIHKHIGFYIGNKKAVSNSSKFKKIKTHHYTFGNKREIINILRYKKPLNK